MKQTLLFFVTIFLIGCNKSPKCNGDDVQKQVIIALKKKISDEVDKELSSDVDLKNNPNYTSFLKIFKNREKYLDALEPKLTNFRTSEVNKDIEKCSCEADLNIVEKYKVSLKDIENEWVGGEFGIENYTPSIKYSAQITDDKKIYINIENSEEIDVIKRNIFAKVLGDVRDKYQELINSSGKSLSNYGKESSSLTNDITPGNFYYVNANEKYPVYFYNSPNENDRKNSKFTTSEKVYVESISGDFGFVRFTNSNNQTSKGWIHFSDLIL